MTRAMKSGRPPGPWLGALAAGAVLTLAGAAGAQSLKPGDRVQASPLHMESGWEPCEIVQAVQGGYAVKCARGTSYVVASAWVRRAPWGRRPRPPLHRLRRARPGRGGRPCWPRPRTSRAIGTAAR